MLFHALVVEAMLPIRVIFGYDGFKTELSLRQKYQEYLEGKTVACYDNIKLEEAIEKLNTIDNTEDKRPDSRRGYGVTSLPDLIVAGENSIVKTNGMPYGLVVNEVDYHCWLASYRRNPLILFLELLWTRLSYRYDLPSDVFGCDVQLEGLAPFAFVTGTKTGWVYQFYPLDEEGLKHYDKDKAWEPVVLEQNEFILMNLLCEGKEVKVSELCRYVNGSAEDIIRSLNKKRLVCVDDESVIRLLTKACVCGIDPELGYVAGDNDDGRFMGWINTRMKKHLNP